MPRATQSLDGLAGTYRFHVAQLQHEQNTENHAQEALKRLPPRKETLQLLSSCVSACYQNTTEVVTDGPVELFAFEFEPMVSCLGIAERNLALSSAPSSFPPLQVFVEPQPFHIGKMLHHHHYLYGALLVVSGCIGQC